MNDDYIYGHIWKTSEDLVRLVELEIRRGKKKKWKQPEAGLTKIH